MRVIVLSSVVSLLLLIFSPISLYSQIKIFDFESVNYLFNPFKSIIMGNDLVSINTKSLIIPGEKQFNYFIVHYNLEDGSIQDSRAIELGLVSESYFVKSMYKHNEDIVIVSKRLEKIPNQVTLTKLSNNGIKVYFEKENTYNENILIDKYRPLINDTFYKIDPTSIFGDVNYQTQKLYKIEIDGDSLDKQLVFTLNTESQYTIDYIIYDNANYFTVLNIYNSVLFEQGIVDTLNKFEIYRINKLDLTVDTLVIDKEFTYFSPKTFEINDKFYFAVGKQDSSIKNNYLLDNKITIFGYDIETNKLEKVKELEFKNKFELNDIHYDKFSNHLYFYGSSFKDNKISIDGTFSDYWIAEVDNEFNLKNELKWNWTTEERLRESVYTLNSDSEGLIISIGETDMFNSSNSKYYFFKMSRDLVTDVNQPITTFNFSLYPNPTRNFIKIKTLGLPYNLELYDYSGRKVIEKIGIFEIDYNLDVSEFPQGLYTLKVDNKGIIQSKNLIITK